MKIFISDTIKNTDFYGDGKKEQVRTVDTPDFYNTINIDIEKSIWLYVINNVSLLATLLRVCKVIRLLAQVT